MIIAKLKETYPALTQRNFRYYWFGQCISMIGTWIQATAQQWLVYTLTKSALLLGLLGVAQFGPVMCLSLFAGVFIDRYPKKNLIILTQISLMLQAFILAFLVWSGHVTYWNVLILAVLLGLVNTLDQPTRQSFIPELVERKDLRSAIGLNSAIFNVARMIGPAIAAVLMDEYGAGPLFFLNGISFIPVIFGLYSIKTKPHATIKIQKKIFAEIFEGLKYIKQSPPLLSAVLCTLAVGTFVMNFNIIIPLYASEVLNQGVKGYGFLLSATGAGSFVGALLVASWAKGNPKMSLLFGSAFIVSALLVVVEPIHSLSLAAITFTIIGFFNILFMTTANSTLQINSSEQFRGRVMSVYSFAFLGSTPIGNLFAGSIMEKLGAGMGISICGAVSGLLIVLIIITTVAKKHTHQQNV
ncbi:MFS transporter [Desulfosporosinus sp. OT]|uniref:MFS transporter n=1 Tax=Desulfosporosinus sp. OT TaxID=913865 RepID=UPI000223A7CC|nr:MFS transporter [Desulfosporosinus sp. OT]EGW37734.1 major Facilitator Superfamily protein [Desulfosporosinus sp. OT]